MAPPNRKRMKKGESAALAFTVNGVDYSLTFDGVTSRHELELFKASRLTMGDLREALASGAPPRFALAALMYLAIRQGGNGASYDALLDELDEEVAVEVATPEDDAPEA